MEFDNSAIWRRRLSVAASSDYSPRYPLLNKIEVAAFYAARKLAGDQGGSCKKPSFYTIAQVGLPGLINSEGEAFWAISMLRIDLAVIARSGELLAIIEIHGPGHYGNTPKDKNCVVIRDLIKRVVCDRAGIKLIEIKGDNCDTVKKKVSRELSNFLGFSEVP